MRNEFEKLNDVSELLCEHPDIMFEDGGYVYHGDNQSTALITLYMVGAWYVYQESQKQIIEQQNKIDSVLNKLCQLQYSSGERCYNEIKGLLN